MQGFTFLAPARRAKPDAAWEALGGLRTWALGGSAGLAGLVDIFGCWGGGGRGEMPREGGGGEIFLALGSRFRVLYYKPHWHPAGCAGEQPGRATHV